MRAIIHLTKRGDTIVEVLIAITIISVVLVAAYTSANHSLNNSRQSQERGEALKIAETQIELLFANANDPTKNVYSPLPEATNGYCFNSAGNNSPFPSTYHPFTTPLASDDFSKYAAIGCQFSFYNVAIKYQPPSGVGLLDDFFTIQVRWDRYAGGRDEIMMNYRLHQ